MVTPPMPVHPHPRFGIGAIPIRGITLRHPNARSRGDTLFSKERGLPLDYPLTGGRCRSLNSINSACLSHPRFR
jgi:hypothetical protein